MRCTAVQLLFIRGGEGGVKSKKKGVRVKGCSCCFLTSAMQKSKINIILKQIALTRHFL